MRHSSSIGVLLHVKIDLYIDLSAGMGNGNRCEIDFIDWWGHYCIIDPNILEVYCCICMLLLVFLNYSIAFCGVPELFWTPINWFSFFAVRRHCSFNCVPLFQDFSSHFRALLFKWNECFWQWRCWLSWILGSLEKILLIVGLARA